MTAAATKMPNSTLIEEALEKLEMKFFTFAEQDALTPTQVKEVFHLHDEAERMMQHLDKLPIEMRNRAGMVATGFRMITKKFRRS